MIFGAVFLGAGLILWMRSRNSSSPVWAGSALTLHPSTDADQSTIANLNQALKAILTGAPAPNIPPGGSPTNPPGGTNPPPTNPPPGNGGNNPPPTNPPPTNPPPGTNPRNNPSPLPGRFFPRTPEFAAYESYPGGRWKKYGPNFTPGLEGLGDITGWAYQGQAASNILSGGSGGFALDNLTDLIMQNNPGTTRAEARAQAERDANIATQWFASPEVTRGRQEQSISTLPEWQQQQLREAGLGAR